MECAETAASIRLLVSAEYDWGWTFPRNSGTIACVSLKQLPLRLFHRSALKAPALRSAWQANPAVEDDPDPGRLC